MRLLKGLTAACLCLLCPALYAAEVTDDAGRVITLEAPAARIISLAPSLTELVFAAGAGARLVGVIAYSDYPEAALSIPRVGRYDMLDMERILALEPDLVLAWQSGNPRSTVARLRELGLTVYLAEPKSLESIPTHLERIGILADTESAASRAVASFNSELRELRQEFGNEAPINTFYQIWNEPLITAGGNELINDIIRECGGVNVFGDIRQVAPKVSTEAVLARSPEVIVASGIDRERPDWLDDWRRWPALPAAARGNLFSIPPALLQRHTPRVLEGTRAMCEYLASARQRRSDSAEP